MLQTPPPPPSLRGGQITKLPHRSLACCGVLHATHQYTDFQPIGMPRNIINDATVMTGDVHSAPFGLLGHTHTSTDVGYHTSVYAEARRSAWEAHVTAARDGKHPEKSIGAVRAIVTHGCHGCLHAARPRQNKAFQAQLEVQSHVFVAGPTFKHLLANNSRTHPHASKRVLAPASVLPAARMLKPLSCCLLSHYSIACYFLKHEKAPRDLPPDAA